MTISLYSKYPVNKENGMMLYCKSFLGESFIKSFADFFENTLILIPSLIKKMHTGSNLGSAELLSVHRQRVADVAPHSDDNDEKPPDFG